MRLNTCSQKYPLTASAATRLSADADVDKDADVDRFVKASIECLDQVIKIKKPCGINNNWLATFYWPTRLLALF